METALETLKEKEKLYDREHQRLCGQLTTCKLTLEESVKRINDATSEVFKDSRKMGKLEKMQMSLTRDLNRLQRECSEVNKAYGHVFEKMAIREQLVRETGLVGFQMENTRDAIIAREMSVLNARVDEVKAELENITREIASVHEQEENIVKQQEEYYDLLALSQKYEEERRLAALRLHECQSLVLEIEKRLPRPSVSVPSQNKSPIKPPIQSPIVLNPCLDDDYKEKDSIGKDSFSQHRHSGGSNESDESASPLVYRNKKEVPLEGFTSSHYMTFSKHVPK